jgi:hypothetical protein
LKKEADQEMAKYIEDMKRKEEELAFKKKE